MSREGWIAAGITGVLGFLYWRGRQKMPRSRIVRNAAALDGLHPDARAAVVDLLDRMIAQDLSPTIVSARRSCAEQRAIYAQGRTAPGPIVTGANGCQSWHVLGRAVDLDAPGTTDSTWRALGAWWKTRGGVWGGDFPNIYDPKHFEYHPGLKISDLCPDPNRCESVVVT